MNDPNKLELNPLDKRHPKMKGYGKLLPKDKALLPVEKTCPDCKLTKPRAEFYLRERKGRYWLETFCKACHSFRVNLAAKKRPKDEQDPTAKETAMANKVCRICALTVPIVSFSHGSQKDCDSCRSGPLRYCPNCKQIKTRDKFAKHSARADGLQPFCKECEVVLTREWKERYMQNLAKARNVSVEECRKMPLPNFIKRS